MKRHRNDGLRKVCGCPRRNWPKCAHSWYFNFKPRGGQAYRFSLDKHFNKHIDSKTEAAELAADLRKLIRGRKFGQPAPRESMTLRQLADTYLERYAEVERKQTVEDFRGGLRVICQTPVPHPTGGTVVFGAWRVSDIVTDSVERYREARRAQGTGPGGTNRSLSRLRAVFNWAIKVGYVDATPFKRHGQTVVKLSGEVARSRRLQAGEDAALLAACQPHLRAVVECALETGMRRGEILSLQWSQVLGMVVETRADGSTDITWVPRAEIALPAGKTKTARARTIPISTRLKAVLEMRRLGPSGEPLPSDGFVFGTEIGTRLQSVKRAWHTAVLRAHGYSPAFTDSASLSAASRARLAEIDLHFHDLRREAGSRWLEGGVALHTVRDWLGHSDISQTDTYLAGTTKTQHDQMAAFDARRDDLQKFATESGKGVQRRARTATAQARKARKTADGRKPATM